MPEERYDDIRQLLDDVATGAPAFAPFPERTIQRARRRAGATISLVSLALVAAVVVGFRTLPSREDGIAVPPTPPVEPDLPRGLYAVDIGSGEQAAFAEPPEGADDFALSPDAERIAYIANDATGHPQVFVMDVVDGAPQQLTHERLAARAPAWSPDGSRIAYRGLADDTTYEIYLIDASGGAPQRLTSEEGDVSHTLAWTRGGAILYQTFGTARYPTDDLKHVLRRIDLESREATTIVTDAALPDPSPDGSRIAFDTWSKALVTVAGSDGSSPRVLPPPGWKHTGFAKWSPDGERLALIEAGDLNQPYVGLGNGTTYLFDLATNTYTFSTPGDLVDWIDDDTILVSIG